MDRRLQVNKRWIQSGSPEGDLI